MHILFILNDPPYGTERVYNGLRLAHALAKKDLEASAPVFVMADARRWPALQRVAMPTLSLQIEC